MKSKDMMKKTFLTKYDKDSNYQAIVNQMSNHKKSKKYKYSLIVVSMLLVIGVLYAYRDTTSKDSMDDSYFFTTIYAEDVTYDIEDEITITWDASPMDLYNLCYEFPYYVDIDEPFLMENGELIIGPDDQPIRINQLYTRGMRIDLKIQGDNIDKVRYNINDTTGTGWLYKGVSGYVKNIPDEGEVIYTHKYSKKDLSVEEKQLYLDMYKFTDKKAKDFTQEEWEEFLIEKEKEFRKEISDLGSMEAYYNDKIDMSIDTNFLFWNVIDKGMSLDLLESEQDDMHTIFITKAIENIDEYKDSNDFYGLQASPSKYYGSVLSPQGLAEAIAKETSITIDIVYKNGIVHTKTMTFELVETTGVYEDWETGEKYEYTNEVLQGIIK